jgi:hypothetical protein
MHNNANTTKIFSDVGLLAFNGKYLATRYEYELADRCVGSIFEVLNPQEKIEIQEGVFTLDEDLELIEY